MHTWTLRCDPQYRLLPVSLCIIHDTQSICLICYPSCTSTVCGGTMDKISPRSPRYTIVNLFVCASHKMYLQSGSGSSLTPLLTTCIIVCFWLSSVRWRASQQACFDRRWNKDSDMPKQAPESSAALSLHGKILRPRSWRQCRMKISHGEALSIELALLASHLQERVSQRPAD